MSRKGGYRMDYNDDYDIGGSYDYDDYYDYDYDAEVVGETSQAEQAIVKSGMWRCSICTYDNDESSSACDVCGVFRDTSVNASDGAVEKEVPFKFDSPSPDDLVSAGKNSSGSMSRANSAQKAPSVLSSSNETKRSAKNVPTIKKTDSCSISLPKDELRSQGQIKSSTVSKDILEATSSSLRNFSLDINGKSSKASIRTRETASYDQYKPEPWMFPDKEKEGFCPLNLAIVGHVDSGKSTLSGRLLHLLGRVSQKEMHKYEKEAKMMGKESFSYAWALDESAEERERGVTMTVAVAYFDTNKYHVVVLDSPGHRDFVPNMISGATQADAAILVIDASLGAFEAGMKGNGGGGQTKEHAQLIRSFGVEQLIVAVNKMDSVGYSQERFDDIKSQLGTFLRSCGFKESSISWVPISAMQNQNLTVAASDAHLSSWYKGPFLLGAIDSLQPPVRDFSRPLCMPISEVIQSKSGQVAASGKLEAGAIKNGSKVLVLPYGDVATVRSIEQDSQKCMVARAGDNVSVCLLGVESNRIMKGGVLCHPDFPVATATRIELKILVLDIMMPIVIGSQVEFHVHHVKEAATVVKILSLIDKFGNASIKAPRCLTSKKTAVIEVIVDRAVCVEEFSRCRALGRAFLRSLGKTVAAGIITKIHEEEIKEY